MLSDLVKSGSWAVALMAICFAVGYAVTGSAGFAVCIALLGGSVGSFAYFLHERLWKAFKWNVIAGLDPAISRQLEPDARVKPGHDDPN